MPYRLDEKTHKIFIDAPSVTTIVNEVYPFDASSIKPEYLKMGQQKGTCVHKQIEMYIKYGSRIGCTCKKKVKTHIEQGKWLCDWWDKNIVDSIENKNNDKGAFKYYNELIMYSLDIDLTGIADCILVYKNYVLIIDWKTTKELHKEKEAMQLAMYYKLFTKNWPNDKGRYMIVNSNKKTSYELTPEQMEQGKQDALKGLQKYYDHKGDKNIWN